MVAVAVLALTAVKAMAEDGDAVDHCPAPPVLEAGAEDATEAAVWAAEDAAWSAAMTAALASLPDDDEPGPLSDALLAAWTQVVLETGVMPAGLEGAPSVPSLGSLAVADRCLSSDVTGPLRRGGGLLNDP